MVVSTSGVHPMQRFSQAVVRPLRKRPVEASRLAPVRPEASGAYRQWLLKGHPGQGDVQARGRPKSPRRRLELLGFVATGFQALCILRGAGHCFDNVNGRDARALVVIIPAQIGPEYFREVAVVVDAAGGDPPDRAMPPLRQSSTWAATSGYPRSGNGGKRVRSRVRP